MRMQGLAVSLKRFVCIMAGIEISEAGVELSAYLTCRNCVGRASFPLKVPL